MPNELTGAILGVLGGLLAGLLAGAALTYFGVSAWARKLRAQSEEIRQRSEDSGRQLAEARDTQARAAEDLRKLTLERLELEKREQAFNRQAVSYAELKSENELCKRDLRNAAVAISKSRMDEDRRQRLQDESNARAQELATRYLRDTVKNIMASVSARNFAALKQRLLDVVGRCRAIGFTVSEQEEAGLVADLKAEFERAVRAEFEREEQARIRAQIREEQRLQREIDRELQQAETEKAAASAALEKALAEAKGQYSQEVEALRRRLAEAEAKAQRAISRAQTTKAGNVYVISNIGAFGEGVFKIGMTRREEPKDRVVELSGAPVPFPYDVHMMIASDDAPALENSLHRSLLKFRMNRANPRKEFFRTSLEAISEVVEASGGKAEIVAAEPPASEYRQSLEMSDKDAEYIDEVFQKSGLGDELASGEEEEGG